jgi:hypothetical protein
VPAKEIPGAVSGQGPTAGPCEHNYELSGLHKIVSICVDKCNLSGYQATGLSKASVTTDKTSGCYKPEDHSLDFQPHQRLVSGSKLLHTCFIIWDASI